MAGGLCRAQLSQALLNFVYTAIYTGDRPVYTGIYTAVYTVYMAIYTAVYTSAEIAINEGFQLSAST